MIKFIRNNKINAFYIILISFLGIILRYKLLEYKSDDLIEFLNPWYNFIKTHGGFHALKYSFADYTPPYLYIMAVGTYLKLSSIIYLKAVSIIFDYIAAITVALIVKKKYNSANIYLSAYTIILFLPTVVLNSSYWAQCDIIFTTFILLSIYMLANNKITLSTIFYAVSFTFKLQAIFIAPLYLILLLKKKFKIRHLAVFVVVYIFSVLPAVYMGGSLSKLLTVYLNQSSEYTSLTKNAPTLFMLYPQNVNQELATYMGIAFTMFLVLSLCLIQIHYLKDISYENIIELAFIFVLVVPYFLPRMHDRYFFLADVFSVIYAFYFPKRKIGVLIVPVVSLFVYINSLFHIRYIPFRILSVVLFLTIVYVLFKYFQRIRKSYLYLQ
ncbi:Mannosyltransferase related to Gpi18 [Clostridium acidisoli DSM 12555]|uniref:Mannosyltransferase related to Gpi18 n=1 Tax=Clostridium acidisoli DSM 12555 TaxID=1121291 RepID=A0A1W1XGS4_9CLOT|nr:hypothetical protein [Clostridium acidisoli]SMC23027.1 Mannosyltransferase related to Gpi18 [Clostridium acidisoli DSM 12555]